MATDESSAPTNRPNSVAAAQEPRRGGRILLTLAIVVLGALVVGGGVGLVIYNRATALDRSTPEVVADQFLDAGLVLRDPRQMSLFVCSSWSADAAMVAVAAPADPKVIVSWGDVRSTARDKTATVSANVEFSVAVSGGYQQSVQSWRLTLVDENGWRVCSLSKG